MIDIQHLVKIYRTGDLRFKALDDVSLRIEKGEFTAIMGPSGSGKSTLMNLIGCLDSFDRGRYVLNGVDVTHMTGNELAEIRNKEIGFVFQAFNLIPRVSLLANVELPMSYYGTTKKERRKKAIEALEHVGLGHRLMHMPNQVSGGEKQRTAIARAMVNQPSIILADEPTGNLDSKSSAEIMKIFHRLNEEGVTIIMVTHEHDIAIQARRIIRFKDGKIVSDEIVTKSECEAKRLDCSI